MLTQRVRSTRIEHRIDISGDIISATQLGNVELTTAAGNVSIGSGSSGDLDFTTTIGNVTVSTAQGDVSVTSTSGNATFGVDVGDTLVKASSGGVTLQGGSATLVAGPAKASWSNGTEELGQLLFEVCTLLSTTLTPGFNGPISTAPQFQALANRVTTWRGA